MPELRTIPADFRRLRGAALPGAAFVLAMGVAGIGAASAADVTSEIDSGARIYAAECAACHGSSLEGQPRWWQADASGQIPAPPLDGTGHAWQHSDAQLIEFIANSMASVAGPDYRSGMPAFAGRLGDAEMLAVVAFIKSRWPDGTRAAQTVLNPGGEEALVKLLQEGGDWTFPPDCLDPVQRAGNGREGGTSGRGGP
jgi:mono/diheme cytochrome c family protein